MRRVQEFENTALGSFVEIFDFDLDPFQIEACQELEAGRNVLVAAPTAAGKTVVADFGVSLALAAGLKLFYTTPIKALSNQKYRDFLEVHGEEAVGLLTGDTVINPHAQIIVMTTEVLRNMLYAGSDLLADLGYVVLDEVHYLADKFRGPVWEEVLLNLPMHVRVICLSATVSNAEEFGSWLIQTRGDTSIIVSERRPVPLHQHMLVGPRIFDLYQIPAHKRRNPDFRPGVEFLNPGLLAQVAIEKNSAFMRRGGRRSGHWRGPRRGLVVQSLQRGELLPAIVFVFSRVGCEKAVEDLMYEGVTLTTAEEMARIDALAQGAIQGIDGADMAALGVNQWLAALRRGIGAHHAGLLPIMKETVEKLFIEGLLKVVYATETLALGVNMPARTVVIESLTKWDGSGHVMLSSGEYTQLTGRAGRRGIDSDGHALVIYTGETEPAALASLASKRTYPLHSAFRPTYNMAVNVLSRAGIQAARDMMDRSFAQFEADRSVGALAAQAHHLRKELDALAGTSSCHLGSASDYSHLLYSISATEKEARQMKKMGDRAAQEELLSKAQELRIDLRNHPVHLCPDRDSHLAPLRGVAKMQRRYDQLIAKIEGRTNSLSHQLQTVLGVLEDLGYIHDGQVSDAGTILKQLYSERDIIIAQALRNGLWDALNPDELAAVACAVTYVSRSDSDHVTGVPSTLPKELKRALKATAEAAEKIARVEAKHHREQTPPIDMSCTQAMYAWSRNASLPEALDLCGLPAGDFVRCCRLTIDVLDQLATLKAYPHLTNIARRASGRLSRGVVSWSSW
ncbi:MAG: DEAD/DEAH box helicase [Actinomycetaceae bacterium]|nr:DEAD/DEAH box helicase [Actinomycetaceae bacterium]